ncbi:MAG TPA: hypothetical protein VFJ51_05660 [Nitrososphaeraceae archaeon]|nr:hypothetical protein [Nitrososphaeraceae archaeon]
MKTDIMRINLSDSEPPSRVLIVITDRMAFELMAIGEVDMVEKVSQFWFAFHRVMAKSVLNSIIQYSSCGN